jgi:hypothetical protein
VITEFDFERMAASKETYDGTDLTTPKVGLRNVNYKRNNIQELNLVIHAAFLARHDRWLGAGYLHRLICWPSTYDTKDFTVLFHLHLYHRRARSPHSQLIFAKY